MDSINRPAPLIRADTAMSLESLENKEGDETSKVNCFWKFLSLIDDGFEHPNGEVIKRRMETLLLVGALVFSMVVSLMASIGFEDYNLSASYRNRTFHKLAVYEYTSSNPVWDFGYELFMPDRIPGYIEYAKSNLGNENAYFADDERNIYFGEKILYETKIFKAEICVLVSFSCVIIAFFSFNHTRNSFTALLNWYRVCAILIYLGLYMLVLSISYFNSALVHCMINKMWEVDIWIHFTVLKEFLHTGPAAFAFFVTFLGMIRANHKARVKRRKRRMTVAPEKEMEKEKAGGRLRKFSLI